MNLMNLVNCFRKCITKRKGDFYSEHGEKREDLPNSPKCPRSADFSVVKVSSVYSLYITFMY